MRAFVSVRTFLSVSLLPLAFFLISSHPGVAANQREAGLPAPYQITLTDRHQLQELQRHGYDVGEGEEQQQTVTIFASPNQARQLQAKGFRIAPQTAAPAKMSFSPPRPGMSRGIGFDVFRPWSIVPGIAGQKNIKTELTDLAAANTDVVKAVKIGSTVLGQDLMAYKLTSNATTTADGARPAVLFNAAQHAREWLTVEMSRRLLNYVVAHKADADMKAILNTTEVWVVPIANPDGYDFTFLNKSTRLWRKNLRDTNSDGQITVEDGVDLNRNFPSHWGQDNEGSSPQPASETYRGPSPSSEPETKALAELMQKIQPKTHLNIHSYAEVLLFPQSWQTELPAADFPLLRALAGTSENPAVDGYQVESRGGDLLYKTNGNTADYSFAQLGALSLTPEIRGGFGPPIGKTLGDDKSYSPNGFVFQDNESDIEQEFTRLLPFLFDVIRSAKDPQNSTSHLGNKAADFEVHSFETSYGNKQTIEVNAKRSLGAVTAFWKMNGGTPQSNRTQEWTGGSQYGNEGNRYYHRMRSTISGVSAGDHVEVWFEAGGKKSPSFTYRVADTSNRKVLLIAAEDYSGVAPNPTPLDRPQYLDIYKKALQTNGVDFDTYDVDEQGRKAPDALGVLSHYDAVLWYTGDDTYVREPGQPEGTGTTSLFRDEVVNARDYLNEGGKLIVLGKHALEGSLNEYVYNPLSTTRFCPKNQRIFGIWINIPAGQKASCLRVANDFLEDWLGVGDTMPSDFTPATTENTVLYRAGLEELPDDYQRATIINTALKKIGIPATDPVPPKEIEPPKQPIVNQRKRVASPVKVVTKRAKLKKNRRTQLVLQCPQSAQIPCQGELRLAVKNKRSTMFAGKAAFTLPAGKNGKLSLAINNKARQQLRRMRKPQLTVTIQQTGGESLLTTKAVLRITP